MESQLAMNKTYIFDLDGTLVKHNGYLIDGHDTLLPGVKELFDKIDKDDFVLVLTARPDNYAYDTYQFFSDNNLKIDAIIYNMPHGERILFNDKKPDGYKTAYAYNLDRDKGVENYEDSND